MPGGSAVWSLSAGALEHPKERKDVAGDPGVYPVDA